MSVTSFVEEYRFLSAGRLVAMVWAGKSPICSLRQVLKSRKISSKISELKTSIESTARVIDHDEADQLWRTPFGEYWFPAGGEISRLASSIAEQQAGIYTPNEPPLKAGDVILDCGANIGAFSKRCFQYNPRLVISVEPAPGNLSCLKRNLASEVQSGRSIIIPTGLWSHDGDLVLSLDPRNPLRHSVVFDRGAHSEVSIRVRTIDSIVSELGLEKLDFLKMDIEGAELEALEGARETIRKFRPTLSIAVEHGKDLIANARAVIDLVRDIRADYTWDCPYCEEMGSKLIFPDVLVFQ